MFSRNQFEDPSERMERMQSKAQEQLQIKRAWMEAINRGKSEILGLYEIKKKTKGLIKCPVCHKKTLKYEFIPESEQFKMKCSHEDCVDIDEINSGEPE